MKKNIWNNITVIILLVITIFLYSCSNNNDSNDTIYDRNIDSIVSEQNSEEGKKIKILVFCKDDRVKEALDAGATYAGTEYIEKVKGGWLDFDVAVATPDMMKDVGRLGMVLGHLMPVPEKGTVTENIEQVLTQLLSGEMKIK